ncbi:MAG: putative deacylase [Verrucomicrobiales bacterium]|jgi:predicted deacylase
MSEIITTVDFEADGKQVGWLRLPHSVTRSAYGVIPIPIAVIQNGPGPQILLTAGNHGDEYEGQVALTRLIQTLEPDRIRGRILILPALNLPAVLAGTRVSPLDQGNLNRAFPGDPRGGPTAQIADYVEQQLLPMVEVVGDFHSGGASLEYRPHMSTHFAADASPEFKARSLEIVKKLGVPHVMIFERKPKPGTLPDGAMRKGVYSFGGEFGGTGSTSVSGISYVETAVTRLLSIFGAIESPKPDPSEPEPEVLHIFGAKAHVYAPEDGVFVPATELSQHVESGDLCGEVLFPDNPARLPIPVYYEGEGDVVCRRHPGRVERGDCLAHLAAPVVNR